MSAWIWVAIIIMAAMAWATYRLGRAAGQENPPMPDEHPTARMDAPLMTEWLATQPLQPDLRVEVTFKDRQP